VIIIIDDVVLCNLYYRYLL